jgi:hypothetical protein
MLAWAFGDEATQLPEGLERPAHWLKQTERRTDESSGGGAAPSRPDS